MDICFIIADIVKSPTQKIYYIARVLTDGQAFVPLIRCQSDKNVSLPLKMCSELSMLRKC